MHQFFDRAKGSCSGTKKPLPRARGRRAHACCAVLQAQTTGSAGFRAEGGGRRCLSVSAAQQLSPPRRQRTPPRRPWRLRQRRAGQRRIWSDAAAGVLPRAGRKAEASLKSNSKEPAPRCYSHERTDSWGLLLLGGLGLLLGSLDRGLGLLVGGFGLSDGRRLLLRHLCRWGGRSRERQACFISCAGRPDAGS